MEDLRKYRENKISYICMKKCIGHFDKRVLDTAEKVCLNRCAFKFIDALNYGNKVIDLIENKVNTHNMDKDK